MVLKGKSDQFSVLLKLFKGAYFSWSTYPSFSSWPTQLLMTWPCPPQQFHFWPLSPLCASRLGTWNSWFLDPHTTLFYLCPHFAFFLEYCSHHLPLTGPVLSSLRAQLSLCSLQKQFCFPQGLGMCPYVLRCPPGLCNESTVTLSFSYLHAWLCSFL